MLVYILKPLNFTKKQKNCGEDKMKKIFLALILIILISGCAKQELPAGKPSEQTRPTGEAKECADEGEFCGGIAGIICCGGTCQYDGDYPDAGGICVSGLTKKTATETVSISSSIENNCVGFLTGAPEEAETIALIKGGWVRPHSGPFAWGWIEKEKGDFNFDDVDTWAEEAQNNNVATLATIWPYADWDQAKCHSKECEVTTEDQFYPRGKGDGIPKSRCAPCSMEDYKTFLTKLVERYDGDGIEDMQGLKLPIKYWEVLNEPEMKDAYLTFYKGTQEEYVQILKSSKEAIKSACPDCKIVQGGAAGIDTNMLAYWRKIFELGGDDYFDIANIHFINFGDLSTLNVKDFKKLLQEKGINKPLWVTEAEYESESQVESSFTGALNAGASKIFFTRFVVGQKGPPVPGQYSKVYDNLKCG